MNPFPEFDQNDMLQAEIVNDPYPFYHRLRSAAPVYWNSKLNRWIFTRYRDAASALKDLRLSSQRAIPDISGLSEDTGYALRYLHLFFSKGLARCDPPTHTRLRLIAQESLAPHVIESMQPLIADTVNELLSKATETNQLDLINDMAYPLPLHVIGKLLKLPRQDLHLLKQWSDSFVSVFGQPNAAENAYQSLKLLQGYFSEVIDKRKTEIGDDSISYYISAAENGSLDQDELIMMCVLMFVAGHETTTNLIGNGLLALLRNPQQLQLLRQSPDLIDSAVEELLRYDSSIQKMARLAAEDVMIDGNLIKRGQEVFIWLGAANRDPEQFTDPDRLDILRKDNRHLAFGAGIHTCLGAPLARLQAKIALSTILSSFSDIRLSTDKPKWKRHYSLRGLESLPLTCR